MNIFSEAISFLLVFTLALSPVFAKDTSPNPATNSKQALLENMGDPTISEAFHRIQLNLLQTEGDALLHKLFSQSPAFRSMYNYLIQQHDVILQGFERQANSGMIQAVRGLAPQYDLLDKLVVDVATSLGFTKEAINNRKIYVSGESTNAFTVSGSQSRIVVAFERGILRNMTRSEIAAVLAHELGHIRAQHIIKSQMNGILLETLGEMFIEGVNKNSVPNSKLGLLEHACVGVCSHSKKAFEKASINAEYLETSPKNMASINQAVNEFSEQLKALNPAQLEAVFGSYLDALIRVGQIEHAPPKTLEYMAVIRNNLANAGTFKVNPKEFIAHANAITYAVSRAKEKTADQISASTVRNEHLASAFAKLIGLDFEREYRSGIFEQMRVQAKEILENTPPEEMYRVAGTTHPSLVLRINNMLNYQAVPGVMFANPFMKHFLIYESLAESSISIKSYVARLDEKSKGSKEFKEVEKIVKEVEAAVAKQEKTIIELLLAKHVSLTNSNSPRVDNAIQFLTVTRESRLIYINGLQNAAQKVKTAEDVASIKSAIQNHLEVLKIYDQMITRIISQLEKVMAQTVDSQGKANLEKRISLLKEIMSAKGTAELEAIRAQVSKPMVDGNTFRRTKVPVSITKNHVTFEKVSLKGKSTSKGLTCSGLFAQ